jgi:hypothetical protein
LAAYDLDSLGWLLFERLAGDAAERELGIAASAWQGSSDDVREATWADGIAVLAISGACDLRMVWVRRARADRAGLSARLANAARGRRRRPLVLVTNADEDDVPVTVRAAHVLGRRWLSAALDGSVALRLLHPSALGVREGGPGVSHRTAASDAATALAQVFVPVTAHTRALGALVRHHFVVLTGPPEMGKTAIAQMIALALATDGWDVHECIRPEQVFAAWDDDRPQVFVADDAFGSTEYRPDAGERWARDMERILQAVDEQHWLIWTSRPAPLRAGLARVHRERGAERFPQPSEILVDASALDRGEKALILYRHARAAHASGTSAARLLQAHGEAIVEDPHFTPERIRRFAARRLFALDATPAARTAVARLLREELRDPTTAMAASFDALDDAYRTVLVAMLDCPAGAVAERTLAASVRRHADGGLPRPPAELMDRLADHFLRVVDTKIAWVHPSWRDLVIERVGARADARQAFLERAEVDGVLLALSVAGGRAGERLFPLLAEDRDWDRLGDRVVVLAREVDDHDALRLLVALTAALDAATTATINELEAVAEAATATLGRRWTAAAASPAVAALVAWLELDNRVNPLHECPHVQRAWIELVPPAGGTLSDDDLPAADDWLWLTQALYDYRPSALRALRLPRFDLGGDERDLMHALWRAAYPPAGSDAGRVALGASIHRRLAAMGIPYPDMRGLPEEAIMDTSAEYDVYPDQPPGAQPPLTAGGLVERVLRDL